MGPLCLSPLMVVTIILEFIPCLFTSPVPPPSPPFSLHSPFQPHFQHSGQALLFFTLPFVAHYGTVYPCLFWAMVDSIIGPAANQLFSFWQLVLTVDGRSALGQRAVGWQTGQGRTCEDDGIYVCVPSHYTLAGWEGYLRH